MEKNTDNVEEYSTKANNDIINDVYTSYDLSLIQNIRLKFSIKQLTELKIILDNVEY